MIDESYTLESQGGPQASIPLRESIQIDSLNSALTWLLNSSFVERTYYLNE
jgi:hypothetical protein